ncbi:hypothetical protein FQR65_LT01564 [Abscondita terminalis]|nr:hypothetical protein FQR65_LT01564 [Abscondita terminalis]
MPKYLNISKSKVTETPMDLNSNLCKHQSSTKSDVAFIGLIKLSSENGTGKVIPLLCHQDNKNRTNSGNLSEINLRRCNPTFCFQTQNDERHDQSGVKKSLSCTTNKFKTNDLRCSIRFSFELNQTTADKKDKHQFEKSDGNLMVDENIVRFGFPLNDSLTSNLPTYSTNSSGHLTCEITPCDLRASIYNRQTTSLKDQKRRKKISKTSKSSSLQKGAAYFLFKIFKLTILLIDLTQVKNIGLIQKSKLKNKSYMMLRKLQDVSLSIILSSEPGTLTKTKLKNTTKVASISTHNNISFTLRIKSTSADCLNNSNHFSKQSSFILFKSKSHTELTNYQRSTMSQDQYYNRIGENFVTKDRNIDRNSAKKGAYGSELVCFPNLYQNNHFHLNTQYSLNTTSAPHSTLFNKSSLLENIKKTISDNTMSHVNDKQIQSKLSNEFETNNYSSTTYNLDHNMFQTSFTGSENSFFKVSTICIKTATSRSNSCSNIENKSFHSLTSLNDSNAYRYNKLRCLVQQMQEFFIYRHGQCYSCPMYSDVDYTIRPEKKKKPNPVQQNFKKNVCARRRCMPPPKTSKLKNVCACSDESEESDDDELVFLSIPLDKLQSSFGVLQAPGDSETELKCLMEPHAKRGKGKKKSKKNCICFEKSKQAIIESPNKNKSKIPVKRKKTCPACPSKNSITRGCICPVCQKQPPLPSSPPFLPTPPPPSHLPSAPPSPPLEGLPPPDANKTVELKCVPLDTNCKYADYKCEEVKVASSPAPPPPCPLPPSAPSPPPPSPPPPSSPQSLSPNPPHPTCPQPSPSSPEPVEEIPSTVDCGVPIPNASKQKILITINNYRQHLKAEDKSTVCTPDSSLQCIPKKCQFPTTLLRFPKGKTDASTSQSNTCVTKKKKLLQQFTRPLRSTTPCPPSPCISPSCSPFPCLRPPCTPYPPRIITLVPYRTCSGSKRSSECINITLNNSKANCSTLPKEFKFVIDTNKCSSKKILCKKASKSKKNASTSQTELPPSPPSHVPPSCAPPPSIPNPPPTCIIPPRLPASCISPSCISPPPIPPPGALFRSSPFPCNTRPATTIVPPCISPSSTPSPCPLFPSPGLPSIPGSATLPAPLPVPPTSVPPPPPPCVPTMCKPLPHTQLSSEPPPSLSRPYTSSSYTPTPCKPVPIIRPTCPPFSCKPPTGTPDLSSPLPCTPTHTARCTPRLITPPCTPRPYTRSKCPYQPVRRLSKLSCVPKARLVTSGLPSQCLPPSCPLSSGLSPCTPSPPPCSPSTCVSSPCPSPCSDSIGAPSSRPGPKCSPPLSRRYPPISCLPPPCSPPLRPPPTFNPAKCVPMCPPPSCPFPCEPFPCSPYPCPNYFYPTNPCPRSSCFSFPCPPISSLPPPNPPLSSPPPPCLPSTRLPPECTPPPPSCFPPLPSLPPNPLPPCAPSQCPSLIIPRSPCPLRSCPSPPTSPLARKHLLGSYFPPCPPNKKSIKQKTPPCSPTSCGSFANTSSKATIMATISQTCNTKKCRKKNDQCSFFGSKKPKAQCTCKRSKGKCSKKCSFCRRYKSKACVSASQTSCPYGKKNCKECNVGKCSKRKCKSKTEIVFNVNNNKNRAISGCCVTSETCKSKHCIGTSPCNSAKFTKVNACTSDTNKLGNIRTKPATSDANCATKKNVRTSQNVTICTPLQLEYDYGPFYSLRTKSSGAIRKGTNTNNYPIEATCLPMFSPRSQSRFFPPREGALPCHNPDVCKSCSQSCPFKRRHHCPFSVRSHPQKEEFYPSHTHVPCSHKKYLKTCPDMSSTLKKKNRCPFFLSQQPELRRESCSFGSLLADKAACTSFTVVESCQTPSPSKHSMCTSTNSKTQVKSQRSVHINCEQPKVDASTSDVVCTPKKTQCFPKFLLCPPPSCLPLPCSPTPCPPLPCAPPVCTPLSCPPRQCSTPPSSPLCPPKSCLSRQRCASSNKINTNTSNTTINLAKRSKKENKCNKKRSPVFKLCKVKNDAGNSFVNVCPTDPNYYPVVTKSTCDKPKRSLSKSSNVKNKIFYKTKPTSSKTEFVVTVKNKDGSGSVKKQCPVKYIMSPSKSNCLPQPNDSPFDSAPECPPQPTKLLCPLQTFCPPKLNCHPKSEFFSTHYCPPKSHGPPKSSCPITYCPSRFRRSVRRVCPIHFPCSRTAKYCPTSICSPNPSCPLMAKCPKNSFCPLTPSCHSPLCPIPPNCIPSHCAPSESKPSDQPPQYPSSSNSCHPPSCQATPCKPLSWKVPTGNPPPCQPTSYQPSLCQQPLDQLRSCQESPCQPLQCEPLVCNNPTSSSCQPVSICQTPPCKPSSCLPQSCSQSPCYSASPPPSPTSSCRQPSCPPVCQPPSHQCNDYQPPPCQPICQTPAYQRPPCLPSYKSPFFQQPPTCQPPSCQTLPSQPLPCQPPPCKLPPCQPPTFQPPNFQPPLCQQPPNSCSSFPQRNSCPTPPCSTLPCLPPPLPPRPCQPLSFEKPVRPVPPPLCIPSPCQRPSCPPLSRPPPPNVPCQRFPCEPPPCRPPSFQRHPPQLPSRQPEIFPPPSYGPSSEQPCQPPSCQPLSCQLPTFQPPPRQPQPPRCQPQLSSRPPPPQNKPQLSKSPPYKSDQSHSCRPQPPCRPTRPPLPSSSVRSCISSRSGPPTEPCPSKVSCLPVSSPSPTSCLPKRPCPPPRPIRKSQPSTCPPPSPCPPSTVCSSSSTSAPPCPSPQPCPQQTSPPPQVTAATCSSSTICPRQLKCPPPPPRLPPKSCLPKSSPPKPCLSKPRPARPGSLRPYPPKPYPPKPSSSKHSKLCPPRPCKPSSCRSPPYPPSSLEIPTNQFPYSQPPSCPQPICRPPPCKLTPCQQLPCRPPPFQPPLCQPPLCQPSQSKLPSSETSSLRYPPPCQQPLPCYPSHCQTSPCQQSPCQSILRPPLPSPSLPSQPPYCPQQPCQPQLCQLQPCQPPPCPFPPLQRPSQPRQPAPRQPPPSEPPPCQTPLCPSPSCQHPSQPRQPAPCQLSPPQLLPCRHPSCPAPPCLPLSCSLPPSPPQPYQLPTCSLPPCKVPKAYLKPCPQQPGQPHRCLSPPRPPRTCQLPPFHPPPCEPIPCKQLPRLHRSCSPPPCSSPPCFTSPCPPQCPTPPRDSSPCQPQSFQPQERETPSKSPTSSEEPPFQPVLRKPSPWKPLPCKLSSCKPLIFKPSQPPTCQIPYCLARPYPVLPRQSPCPHPSCLLQTCPPNPCSLEITCSESPSCRLSPICLITPRCPFSLSRCLPSSKPLPSPKSLQPPTNSTLPKSPPQTSPSPEAIRPKRSAQHSCFILKPTYDPSKPCRSKSDIILIVRNPSSCTSFEPCSTTYTICSPPDCPSEDSKCLLQYRKCSSLSLTNCLVRSATEYEICKENIYIAKKSSTCILEPVTVSSCTSEPELCLISNEDCPQLYKITYKISPSEYACTRVEPSACTNSSLCIPCMPVTVSSEGKVTGSFDDSECSSNAEGVENSVDAKPSQSELHIVINNDCLPDCEPSPTPEYSRKHNVRSPQCPYFVFGRPQPRMVYRHLCPTNSNTYYIVSTDCNTKGQIINSFYDQSRYHCPHQHCTEDNMQIPYNNSIMYDTSYQKSSGYHSDTLLMQRNKHPLNFSCDRSSPRSSIDIITHNHNCYDPPYNDRNSSWLQSNDINYDGSEKELMHYIHNTDCLTPTESYANTYDHMSYNQQSSCNKLVSCKSQCDLCTMRETERRENYYEWCGHLYITPACAHGNYQRYEVPQAPSGICQCFNGEDENQSHPVCTVSEGNLNYMPLPKAKAHILGKQLELTNYDYKNYYIDLGKSDSSCTLPCAVENKDFESHYSSYGETCSYENIQISDESSPLTADTYTSTDPTPLHPYENVPICDESLPLSADTCTSTVQIPLKNICEPEINKLYCPSVKENVSFRASQSCLNAASSSNPEENVSNCEISSASNASCSTSEENLVNRKISSSPNESCSTLEGNLPHIEVSNAPACPAPIQKLPNNEPCSSPITNVCPCDAPEENSQIDVQSDETCSTPNTSMNKSTSDMVIPNKCPKCTASITRHFINVFKKPVCTCNKTQNTTSLKTGLTKASATTTSKKSFHNSREKPVSDLYLPTSPVPLRKAVKTVPCTHAKSKPKKKPKHDKCSDYENLPLLCDENPQECRIQNEQLTTNQSTKSPNTSDSNLDRLIYENIQSCTPKKIHKTPSRDTKHTQNVDIASRSKPSSTPTFQIKPTEETKIEYDSSNESARTKTDEVKSTKKNVKRHCLNLNESETSVKSLNKPKPKTPPKPVCMVDHTKKHSHKVPSKTSATSTSESQSEIVCDSLNEKKKLKEKPCRSKKHRKSTCIDSELEGSLELLKRSVFSPHRITNKNTYTIGTQTKDIRSKLKNQELREPYNKKELCISTSESTSDCEPKKPCKREVPRASSTSTITKPSSEPLPCSEVPTNISNSACVNKKEKRYKKSYCNTSTTSIDTFSVKQKPKSTSMDNELQENSALPYTTHSSSIKKCVINPQSNSKSKKNIGISCIDLSDILTYKPCPEYIEKVSSVAYLSTKDKKNPLRTSDTSNANKKSATEAKCKVSDSSCNSNKSSTKRSSHVVCKESSLSFKECYKKHSKEASSTEETTKNNRSTSDSSGDSNKSKKQKKQKCEEPICTDSQMKVMPELVCNKKPTTTKSKTELCLHAPQQTSSCNNIYKNEKVHKKGPSSTSTTSAITFSSNSSLKQSKDLSLCTTKSKKPCSRTKQYVDIICDLFSKKSNNTPCTGTSKTNSSTSNRSISMCNGNSKTLKPKPNHLGKDVDLERSIDLVCEKSRSKTERCLYLPKQTQYYENVRKREEKRKEDSCNTSAGACSSNNSINQNKKIVCKISSSCDKNPKKHCSRTKQCVDKICELFSKKSKNLPSPDTLKVISSCNDVCENGKKPQKYSSSACVTPCASHKSLKQKKKDKSKHTCRDVKLNRSSELVCKKSSSCHKKTKQSLDNSSRKRSKNIYEDSKRSSYSISNTSCDKKTQEEETICVTRCESMASLRREKNHWEEPPSTPESKPKHVHKYIEIKNSLELVRKKSNLYNKNVCPISSNDLMYRVQPCGSISSIKHETKKQIVSGMSSSCDKKSKKVSSKTKQGLDILCEPSKSPQIILSCGDICEKEKTQKKIESITPPYTCGSKHENKKVGKIPPYISKQVKKTPCKEPSWCDKQPEKPSSKTKQCLDKLYENPKRKSKNPSCPNTLKEITSCDDVLSKNKTCVNDSCRTSNTSFDNTSETQSEESICVTPCSSHTTFKHKEKVCEIPTYSPKSMRKPPCTEKSLELICKKSSSCNKKSKKPSSKTKRCLDMLFEPQKRKSKSASCSKTSKKYLSCGDLCEKETMQKNDCGKASNTSVNKCTNNSETQSETNVSSNSGNFVKSKKEVSSHKPMKTPPCMDFQLEKTSKVQCGKKPKKLNSKTKHCLDTVCKLSRKKVKNATCLDDPQETSSCGNLYKNDTILKKDNTNSELVHKKTSSCDIKPIKPSSKTKHCLDKLCQYSRKLQETPSCDDVYNRDNKHKNDSCNTSTDIVFKKTSSCDMKPKKPNSKTKQCLDVVCEPSKKKVKNVSYPDNLQETSSCGNVYKKDKKLKKDSCNTSVELVCKKTSSCEMNTKKPSSKTKQSLPCKPSRKKVKNASCPDKSQETPTCGNVYNENKKLKKDSCNTSSELVGKTSSCGLISKKLSSKTKQGLDMAWEPSIKKVKNAPCPDNPQETPSCGNAYKKERNSKKSLVTQVQNLKHPKNASCSETPSSGSISKNVPTKNSKLRCLDNDKVQPDTSCAKDFGKKPKESKSKQKYQKLSCTSIDLISTDLVYNRSNSGMKKSKNQTIPCDASATCSTINCKTKNVCDTTKKKKPSCIPRPKRKQFCIDNELQKCSNITYKKSCSKSTEVVCATSSGQLDKNPISLLFPSRENLNILQCDRKSSCSSPNTSGTDPQKYTSPSKHSKTKNVENKMDVNKTETLYRMLKLRSYLLKKLKNLPLPYKTKSSKCGVELETDYEEFTTTNHSVKPKISSCSLDVNTNKCNKNRNPKNEKSTSNNKKSTKKSKTYLECVSRVSVHKNTNQSFSNFNKNIDKKSKIAAALNACVSISKNPRILKSSCSNVSLKNHKKSRISASTSELELKTETCAKSSSIVFKRQRSNSSGYVCNKKHSNTRLKRSASTSSAGSSVSQCQKHKPTNFGGRSDSSSNSSVCVGKRWPKLVSRCPSSSRSSLRKKSSKQKKPSTSSSSSGFFKKKRKKRSSLSIGIQKFVNRKHSTSKTSLFSFSSITKNRGKKRSSSSIHKRTNIGCQVSQIASFLDKRNSVCTLYDSKFSNKHKPKRCVCNKCRVLYSSHSTLSSRNEGCCMKAGRTTRLRRDAAITLSKKMDELEKMYYTTLMDLQRKLKSNQTCRHPKAVIGQSSRKHYVPPYILLTSNKKREDSSSKSKSPERCNKSVKKDNVRDVQKLVDKLNELKTLMDKRSV